MGVNLREIITKREISMKELAGKKLAIDTFNILYQFLSAIRQNDGTQLMDSHGNVTSHLSGIFYRTINLLEENIKPVFVFDGVSPDMKYETKDCRAKVKAEAERKYADAVKSGDSESARKYAQQTSRLTNFMVIETKELLKAMGLPTVQAIGEGEAQAAFMARKAQVYAVVSQDYDALLFGTPFLIRNLTVSGKKKMPGREEYQELRPEIIALADVLNSHGIDLDQLIKIAMMIGTDFNEGLLGIGPKKALKIVKDGTEFAHLSKIPRNEGVLSIFKNPPISTGMTLNWGQVDEKKLKEILCDRHDFSDIRVDSALSRLKKKQEENKQASLGSFI